MALVCQSVDSIAASPMLRLDLHLAPWRTQKGTNFGFPEMRHAITSTLLVDGGQPTASAYGNRILHLELQVKTASADDTATQIQNLIRELNRPTNLLKTQIGTNPVFFRTFRATPEDVDIV